MKIIQALFTQFVVCVNVYNIGLSVYFCSNARLVLLLVATPVCTTTSQSREPSAESECRQHNRLHTCDWVNVNTRHQRSGASTSLDLITYS